MRNPQRIPKILDLLEKAWQEVPDWRLGQLIENIARDMEWNDAYYMEDDDLEKELRKHIDLP
jgi:uncharacterized protein YihD (DUF1040 family)